MRLLLDTCCLLWLTDDPKNLTSKVREAMEAPDSVLYVSAITAWELGIKVSKGKLKLPQPVSQWFPAVLEHYSIREIPIDSKTAAFSTELPPVHADPFDRILVATALTHGLVLVTSDGIIPKYRNIKVLR